MSHSLINDEAACARLLALVSTGVHPQVAASIVGVPRRTWSDWKVRAMESPDSQFGIFMEQVARAEGEVEARAVDCVQKAITGWTETREESGETEKGSFSKTVTTQFFDWRAAMDFLQRRFGERWQANQKLDIRDQNVRTFHIEGVNPFEFQGAAAGEQAQQGPDSSDPREEGGGGDAPPAPAGELGA